MAVVASSFKARRRLADAAEIEQHACTSLDTPLTAPPPADTMAETRPLVTVYGADGAATGASVPLPGVFAAPIRPDVVRSVHTNIAKNARQAYACLLYTSPSPRDRQKSRMPSSA